MKSFLEYVAEDLVRKNGTDLSRVAVIFPNKRAALFMNEHLARQADHPVWSPAYITISDLFRRHACRQVADPIKLVCDLHRVFVEVTGIDETLDHFYGWGQLLLADFDDLDKNMADADKVFANLRDLRELDDVSYLTDEQKQIIARFFSNFSDDHDSLLKQRFLQLWSRMGDIYHAFNRCLTEQGLAYEGALYREVAEQQDASFEYDTYAFVGFNLIQPVEQRLFALLKSQGKAHFYWDFDHYYMDGTSEAGHYIAQYLADFPNELDSSAKDIYGRFSQPKDIRIISAPTENIQARYISTWLRENGRIAAGRRTALVLCNEGLLQTAIHCLPDEVEKVNITTGYPLVQTPAASLVTMLLNLQTTGYAISRNRFRLRQVCAVLRHPYAVFLSEEVPTLLKELTEQRIYYPSQEQLGRDENLRLLFTPQSDNLQLLTWLCEIMQRVATSQLSPLTSHLPPLTSHSSTDPLLQESVFRTYTLLNRLRQLVEDGDLRVDIITLQRLIGQLILSTSVPFHGEPAEGLQVMGVLETRNLDFDHVLLLSCNEGNMPRGINDTSFIPYNIRKAYGLTTIDHKVSIYSYYFHRLLQRAQDVTIVYNNATQDGQTGEMSRFMLQLMVESGHAIQFHTLQASQSISPFRPQPVEKSPEVMEILRKRFAAHPSTLNSQPSARPLVACKARTLNSQPSPLLTPTAINRYMRCPLQFYYNYVCGLREPEDTEDDTIDNRIFGNIFHEAAQTVYERLMQKSHQIMPRDIDDVLKQKVDIERAVDEAMQKELSIPSPSGSDNEQLKQAGLKDLNGLQLINREVIIHYVRQLLEVDRKLAPFTIIGLEKDVITTLKTPFIETTIGGRIDRLDCVTTPDGGEVIRVIDYKTGSHRPVPLPDVGSIFQDEYLSKHSDYYLQTFLYGCIVRSSRQHNPEQQPVSPALLFIQHAGVDDFDPVLSFGKERINDVADFREVFGQLLVEKVSEIFDPKQPFSPTTDRQRCTYCPYKGLCSLDKDSRTESGK